MQKKQPCGDKKQPWGLTTCAQFQLQLSNSQKLMNAELGKDIENVTSSGSPF